MSSKLMVMAMSCGNEFYQLTMHWIKSVLYDMGYKIFSGEKCLPCTNSPASSLNMNIMSGMFQTFTQMYINILGFQSSRSTKICYSMDVSLLLLVIFISHLHSRNLKQHAFYSTYNLDPSPNPTQGSRLDEHLHLLEPFEILIFYKSL